MTRRYTREGDKDPAAVALGRRGGLKRAENQTPAQRRIQAQRAARKRHKWTQRDQG